MEIPVSDAKAKLTELVRRAEAGEEVVLTRNGKVVARIEAAKPTVDKARRAAALERIREAARGTRTAGPSAARSQDFLYEDDGLPG